MTESLVETVNPANPTGAAASNVRSTIARCHEALLQEALSWREDHPDFKFALRTRDVGNHERLQEGYWFTGTDQYLFFAPYRPQHPTNKTRTIGFVVGFDKAGRPNSCGVDVVCYGMDEPLRRLYARIAADIGAVEKGKDTFRRAYDTSDVLAAFKRFVQSDLQTMQLVIDAEGQKDVFAISDHKFEQMLARVLSVRSIPVDERKKRLATAATVPSSGAMPVATESVDAPINLILYGPPGTGKTHWLRETMQEYTALDTSPAGPNAPPRERFQFLTFHPSFTYEDFVRGIRPVRDDATGRTEFRTVDGKFKQICDLAHTHPSQRFALFIDEINRGNIAKIFGELITLIESNKRAVFDTSGRLVEGVAVQLPGGDGRAERAFGVPKNLDIYGTMNTADRSIALLDVALRRRFRFQASEPQYAIAGMDRAVDGIHLGRLLERINDRLEYLLDADHRIGHAYVMHVEDFDDLVEVFEWQVIPLLQEYFFDDSSRIAMVLGTRGPVPFMKRESLHYTKLFSGPRLDGVPPERVRFTVTSSQQWTRGTFVGVYEASGDDV